MPEPHRSPRRTQPHARPAHIPAVPPPRDIDPLDGVLLVDKPQGPTSHDIVGRVRKTFGIRKVGHGGTLDPQATGLLILLIGRGTKLSSTFIGADKAYEGTIHLGVETNSYDSDGEILKEQDASHVTAPQVEEAMQALKGDSFQTPPMVSAIKVDGVPLYKHARKGRDIERKPRFIHIYEFRMMGFKSPFADFRVRCTKGTYVRSLAHDIGQTLGCGASLSALRRTAAGEFNIDDAIGFKDLLELDRDQLIERIIPMRTFIKRA